MARTALVIYHLRPVPDDAATAALVRAGYTLDRRFPIEGDPLPRPDAGHDIALVHGSLADVTRIDAPGIAEEHRWIEAWWPTGRPYLGICHGLQLATLLLGGSVGAPRHRQAEFGYYPLTSHAPALVPDGLRVFQWHYYGADLAPGAERLASSALYPNQVVRFGPARFGLQCHAELGLDTQRLLRSTDVAGPTRPGAQDRVAQDALAERYFRPMRDWIERFLGAWLREAGASTESSAR